MEQPANNQEALLQQEYERFVEFGQLLDRKMRRYLVQYLRAKLEPGEPPELPQLDDRYFRYFTEALDELFAVQDLLQLCRDNASITRQIVVDTLRWLRKTYEQVQAKTPYDDEVKRLEGWAVTPLHVFLKRWPHLIYFLQAGYDREQLDWAFYRDRFQELISSEQLSALSDEQRHRLELLLTDLLAQWDALLSGKILAYQLTHLAEKREQYLELIQAKVTEYKQLQDLISPFSDYLGWDLSRQLWQSTSFDVVRRYDDLLQDEASLRELADLLGRMREAEIEIEEETYETTIIRQEWQPDEHGRAEVAGIHESDDLNSLLSSEASLLSDPDTELLFLKKYADKGLLTFRYEDRRLVRSEDTFTEVHQRVRQKEKGPFIVCVDTSESMTGRPEQIAKVLCLGILKMAVRENRRAYLINFSIGIKTLDLYDVADSIDELAKFLSMSFHGGTDVTPALYEALNQLRSHDYQDADVLIISDFIMPKINRDALQSVRYCQQNQSTQFHSLTLNDDPNTQVLEVFDTNWVYDPRRKGIIRELTAGLGRLGPRP